MLVKPKSTALFEIILRKEKWDTVIAKCDLVDFYHTYSYHQLAKNQDEEAILACHTDGNKIIALPLLIRNIDGTIYKDATSVYGYPGPITKNIVNYSDFVIFQEKLCQFFREQNIISVFSRLNPFISHQEGPLYNLGHTETAGEVVYIDLNKPLNDQWAQYHKRLRTYINKSRTIYTIKKISADADLDVFIKLYHENMRRVNAHEEYYFDKKYFVDLLNSTDFQAELLLAIHNETGNVAGGALFTRKNSFIQYHLSATAERYLDLNPVKLLIDEVRIKGTQENFAYFNLGGGVGGRHDTLFYFKSGFSKCTAVFKIWKFIVNQNIYYNLVQQKIDGLDTDKSMKYFPHYRKYKKWK